MRSILFILFAVLGPATASVLYAQVPQTTSFQGFLSGSNGEAIPDASYQLTFELFDADTDGAVLWTEVHSDVQVGKGVFSTVLGDDEPLDLEFDRPYWLQVTVGSDPPLAPRIKLTAVPYSLTSRAVHGETNVFPSDGNVGIGTESAGKTSEAKAKLDIEGDLRITVVPHADSLIRILVHDPSDQIVKYAHIDTLQALGLTGPAGPPGPPGPPGPQGPAGAGGNLIINLPFVIVNAAGDTTTVIYPDGTSIHKGTEYFDDGIVISDANGLPLVVIDSDGIRIVDPVTGETVTVFNADGTSIHGGTETFEDGIVINDPLGRPRIELDGFFGIRVLDEDGNTMTQFFPDGTSQHRGLETFEAGVRILDESGEIATEFFPDGTSEHKALETFTGGIAVDQTAGIVLVDALGDTLSVIDDDGFYLISEGEDDKFIAVAFDQDGFYLIDQDDNVPFWVRPDGTSTHSGREEFEGGLSVEVGFFTDVSIDENGINLTRTGILGGVDTLFTIKPDGSSFHRMPETFSGGVILSGAAGITFADGSTQTTAATGGGGTFNGTLENMPLVVKNAGGQEVFRVNTDGTSTHAGLETFAQGLHVPLPNGNIVSIVPNDGYSIKTSSGEYLAHNDPNGNAFFAGNVSKGGGSFKIDHPLEPTNKYLYHSFVESPDMMNVYNGNAVLDEKGEAWIDMPDWFDALNRDFRYQLTCIGGFAPVFVAEEMSGNRFKIAGGTPSMKVSWQVTGIREDAYAETNRIVVEQDKPEGERGTYLHPEAYGVATRDSAGADGR